MSEIFYQNAKNPSSPAEKAPNKKLVNCGRCKSTLNTKEALREHLETCNWKCDVCNLELKDPKSIRKHRANCGQTGTKEDTPGKALFTKLRKS